MPSDQVMALRIWGGTLVIGFAYWLGALARSGIAFDALADLPLTVLVPWKGACTLGLALSVYLAGRDAERRLLALALTVSALADMILAMRAMVPAGVLFSVSHLIALTVFWRNRAQPVAAARLACAIAVPILSFGLSLFAIRGSDVPLFFAFYPLFSGFMAAAAVLSRFPLWLCGLGAVVFICSDVLVLAWLGALQRDPSFGYLTWLTYFGGYAMMARGAVLGLRNPH